MKVMLQISTAQGPAECRVFARFVLQQIVKQAAGKGVRTDILQEQADQHGLLSALLELEGTHAEEVLAAWQGTLQWICPSPLRPKHPRKNWYIGVSALPVLPESAVVDDGVVFQTCRAGGKGGQHVNKTESTVRATHTASGISVRVESERSQHANKKLALALLAQKLAERQSEVLGSYAENQHQQLYQVQRGNPKRVFKGRTFEELA